MATPEYAEDIYSQALPYGNPQQIPKQVPASPEINEPQKKTRVFSKKEKILMSMFTIVTLLLFFGSLLTQVILSNQNRGFQDLQNGNTAMAIENSNLEQEVQELSRYDRIIEMAEEMGLEMNEANVRNVTR